MKILGIHDGHDASACLFEDGKIKIVLEEERITRIKNYLGFPKNGIAIIFSTNNIRSEDVDYVAFNGSYMPSFANSEET